MHLETPLEKGDGTVLLKLGRDAIRQALGGPRLARPNNPRLEARGATFVTLRRSEVLHGCIGSLEPRTSLLDDVIHNAIAAALEDPRATPLFLPDVALLTVEISVLSAMTPIPFTDEESLLRALRPQKDGVVLRYRSRRATFLPQVWEALPDPGEFLAELRQKAGLPADFFSPELEAYRYEVEKFVDPPRE
jgi:hypothetical protein